MHISSLPSPYGIGDLGKSAYEFADFLSSAGCKYWQILPVGPTSYGDSPYQSTSAFAGNEYFVSLDTLADCGLLTPAELNSAVYQSDRVDYGRIFATRSGILRSAFSRFTPDEQYKEFCRENAYWLDSYALFYALKRHFDLKPHWEWDSPYRDSRSRETREFAERHAQELDFVKFAQYMFDLQWRKLREYVNKLGIRIIGDAPLYVAYDSADFWQNPNIFAVDECGAPTSVAGVPPDYFSADGQLWGNPLYDWDKLREFDYGFWRDRIRRAAKLYDVLRIDHFRGFESYFAVPAGSVNARVGEWRKGPGIELFESLGLVGSANSTPSLGIIAEDLGLIDESVHRLVRDCGFPGMKVLQFGFGGSVRENPHAPCNYAYDAVGYTGTHDNDTSLGWFSSLTPQERKRVRRRLPKGVGSVARSMICALYSSRVRTAVVPMQDWLELDSSARMNMPGNPCGNWTYRLRAIPGHEIAAQMRELATKYNR